jgi:hypothetical protein
MAGIHLIDGSSALVYIYTGYTTVGALQSCVTGAGKASDRIGTLGLGMTIIGSFLVVLHAFIDIQTQNSISCVAFVTTAFETTIRICAACCQRAISSALRAFVEIGAIPAISRVA